MELTTRKEYTFINVLYTDGKPVDFINFYKNGRVVFKISGSEFISSGGTVLYVGEARRKLKCDLTSENPFYMTSLRGHTSYNPSTSKDVKEIDLYIPMNSDMTILDYQEVREHEIDFDIYKSYYDILTINGTSSGHDPYTLKSLNKTDTVQTKRKEELLRVIARLKKHNIPCNTYEIESFLRELIKNNVKLTFKGANGGAK